MSVVFKIERDFDLGVGDGEYRLGSRQLVAALLDGLKGLKDEAGQTAPLTLHVQLALRAADESEPFAVIDERCPMGTSKASHRLGLRAMVQTIRQALEPRIAKHGDQHRLVMHTNAVLQQVEEAA